MWTHRRVVTQENKKIISQDRSIETNTGSIERRTDVATTDATRASSAPRRRRRRRRRRDAREIYVVLYVIQRYDRVGVTHRSASRIASLRFASHRFPSLRFPSLRILGTARPSVVDAEEGGGLCGGGCRRVVTRRCVDTDSAGTSSIRLDRVERSNDRVDRTSLFDRSIESFRSNESIDRSSRARGVGLDVDEGRRRRIIDSVDGDRDGKP